MYTNFTYNDYSKFYANSCYIRKGRIDQDCRISEERLTPFAHTIGLQNHLIANSRLIITFVLYLVDLGADPGTKNRTRLASNKIMITGWSLFEGRVKKF